MVTDFSERLKHFRSKKGLSQTDLAKLAGLSQKQISDYEVGISKPRQSTFIKLLDALGVSSETFMTTSILQFDTPSSQDDVIQIYNARKGKYLSLSKSIFTGVYLNPSHALLTTFKGDSMYPTLSDGDMILVDTSKTDILDGQIYLIDFWHEEIFFRVFKDVDGTITLSKDNKDYKSRVATYDDIRVIGQAVYRMGEI